MRLKTAVGMGMGVLLVSGSAAAAPGKQDPSDVGKGNNTTATPTTPAGTTPGGGPGSTEDTSDTQLFVTGLQPANPNVIEEAATKKRPWGVDATWETHRLLYTEDLEGAGANKVLNAFYVGVHYDLTPRDRISASWGIYDSLLADSGETGMRGDDIGISYTRFVNLPYKLKFRGTLGFSIPISYFSQLASNITTLRATLGLSRTFGDLTVDVRASGTSFIDRYAESGTDADGGGQPNTKWAVGLNASAEYRMPFHHPLSLGISGGTSYRWFYDVGSAPMNSTFYGATADAVYTSQPILQSYYGEVYARYVLPPVAGFRTDLTIALANGDPTIGGVSVLHSGVSEAYFAWRQTAEVYGALAVRY